MEKSAILDLKNIDYSELPKYILGSLAVGGGLAAGSSLIKQLRWLKERKDAKNDTSFDDHTIYIDIPKVKKSASDKPKSNSSDTTAAIMLASILGGVGGWKGVNKLYTSNRKKQLQKELDDAQIAHVDALMQSKSSSVKDLWGQGKGVGLIATLATAIATHQILKAYLDRSKPVRDPIKRVQFRTKPMEKEVPVMGSGFDLDKEASTLMSADAKAMYVDFAAKYLDSSDLNNVIKAATVEGIEGIKSALYDYNNYDDFLNYCSDLYKEASVEEFSKQASIHALVNDPVMGEVVCNLAALEHFDATKSSFYKVATHVLNTDSNMASVLLDSLNNFAVIHKTATFQPLIKRLEKKGFDLGAGSLLSLANLMKKKQSDEEPKAPEAASEVLIDNTITPDAKILEETPVMDEDMIDSFIRENEDVIKSIIQTNTN